MKKRVLSWLLALAMLVSLVPSVLTAEVSAAAEASIFVAADGSDANDGTQGSPVATLARAAELARAQNEGGTKAVTVSVAAGKYFMAEPLTLGPADSHVSWVADGEVILTGAEPLTGLSWSEYQNGIWVADVPKGHTMDQLFINGTQQILARYPNYDPDATLQGSTSADNIKARSANWADPTGGYIRALHSNKWGGNSYRITGKENNNLGVSYEWIGDNNRGSGMHSSYIMVENIFEELDSATEWYYDKDEGKLYVMPAEGVDLASATVEAAVTAELIHVQGVQDGAQATDISFTGFTLENTARTMFTGTYVPLMRSDWCVVRSGALFLQDAENITFQNGTIRNIGGNAVFLSGHNKNNVITNNDIINIGSSGVLIAGLPDSCREPSFWDNTPTPEADPYYVHKTTIDDDTPGPAKEHYPVDCTVSYNHIKNVGIWEKQSSQVAISVASRIKVLHNTINIGPRAGVNIGDGTFGGHEIAYNDIFDVQLETDDHGMFNSWGRDRFWSLGGFDTGGNNGAAKEPYSRIDCVETITIHDNRMHFGGRVDGGSTFGIDLDDGSSNYKIYNNLCLNMGIKLREGFHREVYNNILVNGQFNLHCTFEDSYDKIYSNIVIKGSPYALAATSESRFAVSEDVIEKNWFWDLGMAISFPGSYWTELGFEAGSVLGTADPEFRDPSSNDYTVTNEEVMEAIGFQNFPMDQFGKPGCEDVCPVYEKTSPDSNVDVLQREEWQGATISALNDAIMSSTGAGKLDGVYVESAPADSIAAQYGLQTGDVIHTINGRDIGAKSNFVPWFNAIPNGTVVHLDIIRNQLPMEINFLKGGALAEEMIDDQDPRIQYAGDNWEYSSADHNPSNSVNCYNQTMTYKNLAKYDPNRENSDITLDFSGSRVVLYGRKENNMGNYLITISDESGQVLQETVSANNGGQKQDQQVLFDSGDKLTQGEYTITVRALSGDYIIVDAFRVYSAAQYRSSAVNVGPIAVTQKGTDTRVTQLTDRQAITVTIPLNNRSAETAHVEAWTVLYSGDGLRTVESVSSKEAALEANRTGSMTFDLTVPDNSAEMRLAVLVLDRDSGSALAYPFHVDGTALVDGEPVLIPEPVDDTPLLTYESKSDTAIVAVGNLPAGEQAVLEVRKADGTVSVLMQQQVDSDGVAAFVFETGLMEKTALTFTVQAESAACRTLEQEIDPSASITDKSELLAAIAAAEAVLENPDNDKKYALDTWKALQDAFAAAETVNGRADASQEEILNAAQTLRSAQAGLAELVTGGSYTPKAAEKGTYFQIYDPEGNPDPGNKDGGNGVWQARGNQVDTTVQGAWFEMTGMFTSFTLLGANKYDSANFLVEITDLVTGEVTTEEITTSKDQGSSAVTLYENTQMSGRLQRIRLINNQNGNYLEVRGIQCTVAEPADVTDVTLSQSQAELELKETLQLTATVLPANAYNPTVFWSVAPEGIVTVDPQGNVVAVGVGEATITVTTEDGSFTDECTVTVKAHTHSMTHTPAKNATCTEAGNTEYWYCAGCGKYFSDETGTTEITLDATVLPAKGHTPVTVAGREPTCTETGLTEGSICSVCGTVLTEQEELPALGHDFSTEWESDASGHWHVCSRCGEKDEVKAHVPGPEATEDDPQVCTQCGYILEPATGHIIHTPGTQWYHDETQHWHLCTGCDLKMDVEDHTGGTATCTEQAVCEVCGTSYGELAEHEYEWDYDDTQHWKVCADCGAVDGSTYEAHTWVEDEERSGDKTVWYTCACGAEKKASRVIATPTLILRAEQSDGGAISPESQSVARGGEVTFTITPDGGYHIADVLVDGRSVGAVSEYTFQNVSTHHTITAVFSDGSAPVETVETVKGFTDVTAADWFADAVAYAVDAGLMNGTSATTFSPKGDTTRGMIVTILYRLAGSPEVESDNAAWYSDARVWAMEEGISDGTNMDGEITREQLAAMLYRYAGSKEVEGNLDAFADAASVSDWAVDALVWATEEGIVTGKTGGRLDPQAGATRAETAAMLQRYGQLAEEIS